MLSSLFADMSRALTNRFPGGQDEPHWRLGRGWPAVKPQRPGLDRSASAQPASAFLMKDATATGWAMNAVCEPVIDSVAAPIRSAMNRSASGGMALSWSDTRYQDGLVFHPAAVAFSVSAAFDNGRCVAHMTAARSTGTSAQNVSRNCSLPM